MKREKRAITVVLAVILLAQLLVIGAAAGDDISYSPFSVEWGVAEVTNGVCTLSATIYDASTGNPAGTGMISTYQPYIQVTRFTWETSPEYGEYMEMGNEYTRVYFNSATATVSVADAGNYDVSVRDNAGSYGASQLGGNVNIPYSYLLMEEQYWADGGSGGEGSSGEAGELYMNYIDALETNLGDGGIAALKADPELRESLYYYATDIEAELAKSGSQSLGDYLQTYENGKYAAVYECIMAFGDGDDSGGDTGSAPLFTDVPAGVWYEDYVNIASDAGLINGKGNGLFAPNDNMTIAEAITLAVRFDCSTKGTEPVTNSSGGNPWYQPYVDYAEENGLPWQYGDYNAKITRDEFARIFASVYQANKSAYDDMGITAINAVADGAIPDVPMSSSYADDIYTLYRLGVLGGSDTARNFRPDSNILRSEVSAILCRLIDVDRQSFTLG